MIGTQVLGGLIVLAILGGLLAVGARDVGWRTVLAMFATLIGLTVSFTLGLALLVGRIP